MRGLSPLDFARQRLICAEWDLDHYPGDGTERRYDDARECYIRELKKVPFPAVPKYSLKVLREAWRVLTDAEQQYHNMQEFGAPAVVILEAWHEWGRACHVYSALANHRRKNELRARRSIITWHSLAIPESATAAPRLSLRESRP